ncbi:MAG: CAP domain-containing protein [Dehalobacterium sp.]
MKKSLNLEAEEEKMINLINAERRFYGLQPLEVNMRLVKTARIKSRDMLYKNYFSHFSPGYGAPYRLMEIMRVPYKIIGENLASISSVEEAHLGLMNSPGHRVNILNPNFTQLGVGVANGGPNGKLFTQHFIG